MATINTVLRLTDEVTPALNKITQGLSNTLVKMISINTAMSIFNNVVSAIRRTSAYVNEMTEAYNTQYESEVKLYTIMRQRMSATYKEFDSIRNLAKQIEGYGVLSDQIILKGAQEIATFVETKDQIYDLIPALADLTAQQYGYNASEDDMRNVATIVGKILNGNISAFNRLGLVFTDNEKKMLKSSTMEERVAYMIDKIKMKAGEMNKALGLTNEGKIKRLENNIINVNEQLGKTLQPLKIFGLQLKLSFQTMVLENFAKALNWVKDNIEKVTKAITNMATVAVLAGTGIIVTWAVMHWQIVAVIGAIAGLIYIMTELGVASNEVLGGVLGVLNGLLTTVEDILVGVVNVFKILYNVVADTLGVIVNLFTSPKKAIADFTNLLLDILQIIVQIVNTLTLGIVGRGLLEQIDSWKKSVDEWGKNTSETMKNVWTPVDFGNMELHSAKNIVQSVDVAYKAGLNLEDTVRKALEMAFGEELDINSIMDKLNFDSKGALETHDGSLVDIAEDYRELLSKRAVEKFNLQFSQVTPSINIDHVDVHKEADANNVLSTVVDALDDVVNSSLSVR